MSRTLKDRNTPDRIMRQKDNGWKRTSQTHDLKKQNKHKKPILCKGCNNPLEECICES